MNGATSRIDLEPSWLAEIGNEFEQPYMRQLREFLRAEKAAGKLIYPASANWFNAFRCAPFASVEVVILGQDPYHGPGRRTGCASRCRAASMCHRRCATSSRN